MATWTLKTQHKKSAVEVQFWHKEGGKIIVREEGYRWGEFTIESDVKPNIDLKNPEGYELGYVEEAGDNSWELVSLDDGCWADSEARLNCTEEELEEFDTAWEEDFYEGVEELGWSNDDTEYWFYGPLELTNEDTGEVFQGEPDDPVEVAPELAPIIEFTVDESDVTDWFPTEINPAYDGRYQIYTEGTDAWPFPDMRMLDWKEGKWLDDEGMEVDKTTFKSWRGLAKNPNAIH
jgi:hypothetical protein